ncbi:MAG: RidA family protein [Planctomycetaceae bacterium]
MNRIRYSSDTPWEDSVCYSRAVRVGPHVFVSGTTASDEQGATQCVGDAYGQARFIFEKIGASLKAAGADLHDVTRTRMYVTDISRWEEIGRAHAEAFHDVGPAATMVEVQCLINPDHLVEIEVDAIIASTAT